jgi:hypothetical protein
MYDWNALWHEQAGFRTGFSLEQPGLEQPDDVNTLAEELGASLHKPARDLKDIAVYETPDRFILLSHQDGLQMLEVAKHTLFDLTLRVVDSDEGHGIELPYLEAIVDNLATAESGTWRGVLAHHPDGVPVVNGQLLSPDVLPDMVFPEIAYAQTPHFRSELAKRWHDELAAELPAVEAALADAPAQEPQPVAETLGEGRLHEIYQRYAEIVRREQAHLSRLFSDEELHLIAAAFKGASFESAASCRGVWLLVEARMIDEDLDHAHQVDGQALLDKLKTLSYAQEVALIEALAPVRND